MALLRLLGGLRRFGRSQRRIAAATVAEALREARIPPGLLYRDGALNDDIEVLVNGRNIAFLAGLDTPLATDDRLAVFLHGARGFPGG